MAKLRMAHASTHGARKPPGPIFTNDSGDDVSLVNKRLASVSKDDKKATGKRKIWSCKTCCKSFAKKCSMKVHENKAHNPPVFIKCDFGGCDFTTCYKAGLLKHRLKHSDYYSKKIKNLKCSECDFVTWNKGTLCLHKKKHSKQGTLKCSDCDFVTWHKGSLSVHKKNHSLVLNKKKQETLKCSECDFVSPTSYHLKKHKIFVHNIGKLNCEDCDFFTIQIGDLRKHRRKNHPEKWATE